MPTDLLLALENRRRAESKRANDALAAAILPLLACILMIFLVLEWPAFERVLVLSGTLG